jgi:arylsulfatase A-like enzyme
MCLGLLDDVGYGASSIFDGLVDTPNLDALAALLTGRNHHSAGFGLFAETAVDLPGYNAKIPASKGTVAEVLKPRFSIRRISLRQAQGTPKRPSSFRVLMENSG